MRQAQLCKAASRCEHLAGITVLDKPSTTKLLTQLLQSKKPYVAGTLKAILANAVKTAKIFHKTGTVASNICPFCDQNVVEDTAHMFNICPRWNDIRSHFDHDRLVNQLPHCSLFTGIACLPESTQQVMRDAHQPVVLPDISPIQFYQGLPYVDVSSRGRVWLCSQVLHNQHPLWKRAGFGAHFESPLRLR